MQFMKRVRARWSLLGLLSVLAVLAVPSAAPAAGTLDLDQSVGGSSWGVCCNWLVAQRFTPTRSGTLDRVDIFNNYSGSYGDLTVSIRTVDGSGFPTGTILGSGTAPMNGVPYGFFPVALSAPVTAGSEYTVVLESVSGYFQTQWSGSAVPGWKRLSERPDGSSWAHASYTEGPLPLRTYVSSGPTKPCSAELADYADAVTDRTAAQAAFSAAKQTEANARNAYYANRTAENKAIWEDATGDRIDANVDYQAAKAAAAEALAVRRACVDALS
jgi:hypothetical protein